jgi:hypothetical protein
VRRTRYAVSGAVSGEWVVLRVVGGKLRLRLKFWIRASFGKKTRRDTSASVPP